MMNTPDTVILREDDREFSDLKVIINREYLQIWDIMICECQRLEKLRQIWQRNMV